MMNLEGGRWLVWSEIALNMEGDNHQANGNYRRSDSIWKTKVLKDS